MNWPFNFRNAFELPSYSHSSFVFPHFLHKCSREKEIYQFCFLCVFLEFKIATFLNLFESKTREALNSKNICIEASKVAQKEICHRALITKKIESKIFRPFIIDIMKKLQKKYCAYAAHYIYCIKLTRV